MEKQRKKLKKALKKNKKISPHRKNISKARKGTQMSEITKLKLSEQKYRTGYFIVIRVMKKT